MKKAKQGVWGAAATMAFVAAIPTAAYAEDQDGLVVSDAIAAIVAVDRDLLDSRAQVETNDDEVAIDERVAGVDFLVPGEPETSVVIGSAEGEVSIDLPFSDRASEAVVVDHGIVAFDNRNGSLTVPIVRADGSLQVNTVISSADAPTEYRYEFGLPAGAEIVESGESLLFTVGDRLLAGLAPAWAVDAYGTSVPTRFEVEGTAVIQVVEHSATHSYPVVADPWLGINLFGSITVDSFNAQPRVNLNLSPWGWAVYSGAAQGGGAAGIAAGQAILNTAGWDEAWNRSSTVRSALNKASQRQQFECHALGAIAAGTWNLEKFRPNRTVHWSYGVAVHRCNWTTATRY